MYAIVAGVALQGGEGPQSTAGEGCNARRISDGGGCSAPTCTGNARIFSCLILTSASLLDL